MYCVTELYSEIDSPHTKVGQTEVTKVDNEEGNMARKCSVRRPFLDDPGSPNHLLGFSEALGCGPEHRCLGLMLLLQADARPRALKRIALCFSCSQCLDSMPLA